MPPDETNFACGWDGRVATLPGGQDRVTPEDLRDYSRELAREMGAWQSVLFKLSQEVRKLWREREEREEVARQLWEAAVGLCPHTAHQVAAAHPWVKGAPSPSWMMKPELLLPAEAAHSQLYRCQCGTGLAWDEQQVQWAIRENRYLFCCGCHKEIDPKCPVKLERPTGEGVP